jgi:hypothetical protein
MNNGEHNLLGLPDGDGRTNDDDAVADTENGEEAAHEETSEEKNDDATPSYDQIEARCTVLDAEADFYEARAKEIREACKRLRRS